MELFSSPDNIMAGNPGLFDDPQNRKKFCDTYRLLPVEDVKSQPWLSDSLPAHASHFCCATYREKVWAKYRRNGDVPRRIGENLKPTALMYESDTLTLDQQRRNIRPEALGHILSVTHSGGKSLHVVVPIPDDVGEAIINRRIQDAKRVYRSVWKRVGPVLFYDPTSLDCSCATIGHLSRLPGARRNDAAGGYTDPAWLPVQRCLYLNAQPENLDFGPVLDAAVAEVELGKKERVREYLRHSAEDYFADFSDYGADLVHLRKSNLKYPRARKKLARQVLDGGPIPSESQLDNGLTYIGTVRYLHRNFRHLARRFVKLVKAAHPSNLPRPVEDYLRDEDEQEEE